MGSESSMKCKFGHVVEPSVYLLFKCRRVISTPSSSIHWVMVQTSLDVEVIKQYPGRVQVERKVKLRVPGKHFPQLTPAEQKDFYDGTAVEYAERHKFERHLRASWGVAHTGPGIRFICDSDAFDDPDTRGFWTSLALWNRWRHATFKDNREAEKEYLDELPAAAQRPRRRRRKRRRRPRSKSTSC